MFDVIREHTSEVALDQHASNPNCRDVVATRSAAMAACHPDSVYILFLTRGMKTDQSVPYLAIQSMLCV